MTFTIYLLLVFHLAFGIKILSYSLSLVFFLFEELIYITKSISNFLSHFCFILLKNA